MFKKQYITGAFLAVISLFSSCTNLDEEIFSSIPEKDFYKTESEFLAAMVPIYSSMRTLTEHSNWWDLEETTDVCVTPVKNHGLWYLYSLTPTFLDGRRCTSKQYMECIIFRCLKC